MNKVLHTFERQREETSFLGLHTKLRLWKVGKIKQKIFAKLFASSCVYLMY